MIYSLIEIVDYLMGRFIDRSIEYLIMNSRIDLGGTYGWARGSGCSNISVFAGGTLRRNTSRLSPGPHTEGSMLKLVIPV